jgi:methionyl-tRNA formyltransferase
MMGTGQFALPAFRGVHESEHHIVGVFTQPDRRGKGHHQHVNPIKDFAAEHGLPVFQPENINAPEGLDSLQALSPDLCVTAAYGQILSPEVISVPRLGFVNVHASLLPKFRGAAPIAYAILKGETETGITLFQIDPGLDAGPILGMVQTDIGPRETTGQLEARLAELAVPLTLRVIREIEAGTLHRIPQDPSQATRAPRLKKTAGAIDWTKSAEEINRHCRAMQPWPTPFTFLLQPDAGPLRLIVPEAVPCDFPGAAQPGSILAAEDDRLIVQTGAGAIAIARIQPAGKREMSVADFLRGHAVKAGDRLGTPPGTA